LREVIMRVWTGEQQMIGPFDLSQNPKYWAHQLQDGERMLYSGVKDEDGQHIYDGDIVEATIDGRQQFEIHFEKGRFLLKDVDNDVLSLWLLDGKCKVVGNIFNK
jgi:hypothetical protein